MHVMRPLSELDHLTIIFYDGECGLCNRTVKFIIKNDPDAAFLFLSLQSDLGEEFLARHGIEQVLLDTLYLYQKGVVYNRSDAVIQIFKKLRGYDFRFFSFFLSLYPKGLRDWGYDLVAKNRHRFFKPSSCALMLPEYRSRFLENI